MTQQTTTQSPATTSFSPLRRILHSLGHIEEIGVVAALFILGFVLTISTEAFLTPTNLLQVMRQGSYYGIMALGMVFVLSMGDVDLSVGSLLMFVDIVVAICLREGMPIPFAILIGLALGALCGFFNGLLSVVLRIPTIIVTLGTMSVYRGLALVISLAKPISNFPKDNLFIKIGSEGIWGIPTSVIVMLLLAAINVVIFNKTSFGRRVQAIGSNKVAAQFSGIRINQVRLMVMTLNGLHAAIAGILALSFLQAADPSTGPGMEMFVIASAIIGGTALTGGSGSIIGAVLGATIIAIIRNGLVLLGLSAYWGIVATGAVIIAAVAVDYFVKRR